MLNLLGLLQLLIWRATAKCSIAILNRKYWILQCSTVYHQTSNTWLDHSFVFTKKVYQVFQHSKTGSLYYQPKQCIVCFGKNPWTLAYRFVLFDSPQNGSHLKTQKPPPWGSLQQHPSCCDNFSQQWCAEELLDLGDSSKNWSDSRCDKLKDMYYTYTSFIYIYINNDLCPKFSPDLK